MLKTRDAFLGVLGALGALGVTKVFIWFLGALMVH
jgi:hypothetical protein